ncbi:hypothetical protein [Arcobacter sp. CECT 9188]|uniref:hypothetical protein n=1 Tax=Arcobacter sp. CECT 9188 TaxID=2044505 RepID=UPI000DEAD101|nr:hypothetical protein [Arcobacter sp. CECT 9188]RBQ27649.1 hypothetical protein CRU88_02990 [Arcobacter sp. CECT 9188]
MLNKMKYLVFSFLFILFFTGCTTTSKNVETPLPVANEVSNKELFENKDNWQPINKDQILQNIKNEKVVK